MNTINSLIGLFPLTLIKNRNVRFNLNNIYAHINIDSNCIMASVIDSEKVLMSIEKPYKQQLQSDAGGIDRYVVNTIISAFTKLIYENNEEGNNKVIFSFNIDESDTSYDVYAMFAEGLYTYNSSHNREMNHIIVIEADQIKIPDYQEVSEIYSDLVLEVYDEVETKVVQSSGKEWDFRFNDVLVRKMRAPKLLYQEVVNLGFDLKQE